MKFKLKFWTKRQALKWSNLEEEQKSGFMEAQSMTKQLVWGFEPVTLPTHIETSNIFPDQLYI